MSANEGEPEVNKVEDQSKQQNEVEVEPLITPEKRPLLYANRKAQAGKRTHAELREPEAAQPDEAELPTEQAAPVKPRTKAGSKARTGSKKGRKTFKSIFTFDIKPKGRKYRVEEESEESEEEESEDESDEPSQVLEGIIYILQMVWYAVLYGLQIVFGIFCTACRILPWTLGIGCFFLSVYLAGYYITEPHSYKEFPDVGSKLVVAFRMSVWLYLPLFLGMLLKAQTSQSGGPQFYQSTMLTISLCLAVTQTYAENIHWLEVGARTLSMFEVIRLVSELIKLNRFAEVLATVPRILITITYLYNFYYIICEDFGFCEQQQYIEKPHTEQHSGWSVCSVVENLCGSPTVGAIGPGPMI